MSTPRLIAWLAVAGLVTGPLGCGSISGSSKSSSDIVSSPFKWSSASFGSDPQGAAMYRQDVSELTVAFVDSGGELVAFQSRLGKVARDHGVSDWEADPNTYVGMGSGLRDAGLEGPAFEQWSQRLAAGQPERLEQIAYGHRLPTGTR